MSDPPRKRYKGYLEKGSRSRIPRSTHYGRIARAAENDATSNDSSGEDGSVPVPDAPCPQDDSLSSSESSDNDSLPSDNAGCSTGGSDEDTEIEGNIHDDPEDPDNPEDPENPEDPDEYNLNEPVEPDVRLTKFEILVMIVHFVIRFGLSDVAVKALISMINAILGIEVLPPSNYIFNKVFSSGEKKTIYLYCSNCLIFLGKKEDCENIALCPAPDCETPVEAKSLNKGHFFTIISPEDQIREKLLSDGEDLLSYRQNRLRNNEEIRDTFDGIVFNELDAKVPADSSFLTINASTDGAQVFENSLSSVWPLQFYLNEVPPKERFSPVNMMLAGVWFGCSPSMATFLTPMIDILQKTAADGISWFRARFQRLETTRVFCLNFVADTIAKAKLMNMVQFNGYKSCYFCLHPGDLIDDQVRYGYRASYESRTDLSLRQNMEVAEETGEMQDGVKGMSPLYYFPNFCLPWGVVIDVMHSHLLGVAKYLCVSIWMNSGHHESDYYLGPATVATIDRRIRAVHPPSNISRDLRPLSSCALYKANEWRSWIFYYGPVVLQGLLPLRYYRHFCKFSAALYFFSQSCINRQQVVFYGDLLSSFVQEFQEHYGLSHMTYNVHLSEHLKECVTSNGPLWSYSAFPFETGNGYLVRFVKGAKGVGQQIARRYCCYSSIPSVVSLYPPLNDIVGNFCQSILSLRRFKFIGQGAENILIVGNKFRRKFVPSVPEANSMAQALPGVLIHNIFAIKKIIFNASVYTSQEEKEKRRDDSFLKLADGKVLKVVKFFVSAMDNFNQLYILGKQLRFANDTRAIFNLDNFHLRVCQQYRFENGFVVVPATMIKEKCFFITLHQNLSFIATFPNNFERD